ncbi:MAG: phosphotransferase, partial [Nitrospirae bacterium]|nr:phosphotransferase [Nitrospirota bacterium]
MNKGVNCFILAAGLGERLRPVTNHIPKPLLPILGRPVLESVLENVSMLHVNKIGINLHYKKEAVEEWIQKSAFREMITLFPEGPVLDTGGALKNAEEFLSQSAFLVHNSDIISDMDLRRLIDFHISSKNLATIAVHDYPKFNNVAVDRKGFLKGAGKGYSINPETERLVAFTGIAVYEPEFLKLLPQGKSGVVDAWLKAVTSGYRIGTFDVSGCYWSDIGTPAAYATTLVDLMRADGETVYIHPAALGCKDAELDGYMVIESGSVLDRGVSLRNCILLPQSRPERGVYENCIIGPGFKLNVNESNTDISDDDAVLIGTGGSDRKYFRVKRDNGTAVLMQCAQGDPDFERQIGYTRFFRKYLIPVPELIETEPDKMRALFEDLGDMSLYSWMKCHRDEMQIEKVYRQALDILILLHTQATENVSECEYLQNRIFDYDHLRWETAYFIERFVRGVRNITIKNPSALYDELHRLALKVDSFPKTVVHRDFQSQNIMVTKGGIPGVIDYQGARIGPPSYDLASLLFDPYYRLDDDLRKRLLEYYMDRRSAASGSFNSKDFIE